MWQHHAISKVPHLSATFRPLQVCCRKLHTCTTVTAVHALLVAHSHACTHALLIKFCFFFLKNRKACLFYLPFTFVMIHSIQPFHIPLKTFNIRTITLQHIDNTWAFVYKTESRRKEHPQHCSKTEENISWVVRELDALTTRRATPLTSDDVTS